MATDNKAVVRKLRYREYNELTVPDWCLVLKSIIGEADVDAQNDIMWIIDAGVNSREGGPCAQQLLSEELPTAARSRLASALNVLAQECLDRLRAGDPRANQLLSKVLVQLENGFPGALCGELAEDIVLNGAVRWQTRVLLAKLLVGRSFAVSVGPDCWKQIEAQIPQVPWFAGPVMQHLARTYREHEALEIPIVCKSYPDDPRSLASFQLAFEEAFNRYWLFQGSTDRLKGTFSGYPEWVLTLLHKLVDDPPRRMEPRRIEALKALLR